MNIKFLMDVIKIGRGFKQYKPILITSQSWESLSFDIFLISSPSSTKSHRQLVVQTANHNIMTSQGGDIFAYICWLKHD